MKVYAGYTTLEKTCSGFYDKGGVSAHIKIGEIAIRELDEGDDDVMWQEGYRAIVRIPSNLVGGTVGSEGANSIRCKSLGEAQNNMAGRPQRNKAFLEAAKDAWRLSPEEAAKDAMTELLGRVKSREERQSFTRESVTSKLREVGILDDECEISERVWRKPKTKIRIQNALAGDTSAAGALRRDAKKLM